MSEPTSGLEQFQSVKRVLAGQITEVCPAGCYVHEANGDKVFRTYEENMTARYAPVVGDWWIVYQDGYQAISPKAAFEDGYFPVHAPRHKPQSDLAATDRNVERIARVCHEVNRGYCASLGDHSQLAWEDAPGWARNSACAGVKFTLANPQAKPSDSHESWLREKTADGWQYGPVKDPEKKQHPCFVPYEDLPADQKAKDYLFQAVVRALAASA